MTFTAKLALVLMLTATFMALEAKTPHNENPLYGSCKDRPCSRHNASSACGSDCECFFKNKRGKVVRMNSKTNQNQTGLCKLVI
uniref:Secreted protein n=1 Tax=Rhipicephalus appendiculatus TaxID=34631 RepID=A0A131Z4V2_RHIAP